ncbi:hypothetical protein HanRHA438_Chr11g0501701 [Helianthus annuus]|uniref:Uncharacterized protein n=1 Tax=Helianthus annuus TaxID=4232 RepID=A0A251TCP4_HELAN|nr:hypothetical protein HanXRQr2_Chr11g0488901 [Helianthus annuus]KAJ0501420.1 hypothetical protein HanHA300_Chr11g0400601 [Helianthus annuus]KAJ0509217.1 hypothetical protein HanIR_Chr11g0526341 [Helianthus annuus]KAJ0517329.1 hypothetical protein HanHA89_Chr11g0424131 [Helianthus annuus]KAJ0685339.1 hypothetical protein HanLR1_Chr11g0401571 [Helianthus annuus]
MFGLGYEVPRAAHMVADGVLRTAWVGFWRVELDTAMAMDSGNGRFGDLGFCCFCHSGRTLYLIFV